MTRTRRHTGGRPILGRRDGGRDKGLDLSNGTFARLRRGNSDGGHYRRLERRRMQESSRGGREERKAMEKGGRQTSEYLCKTMSSSQRPLNSVAAEDLHLLDH